MPIPELELRRAQRVLQAFCDRVPDHVRPQLSYMHRVRRNTLELVEVRPAFRRPKEKTEMVVAKFVYSVKYGTWGLRWSDRNERWHVYEGFEARRRFHDLFAEVSSDPTGIFFG